MPLTAMVDGELRISSRMGAAEWAQLRSELKAGRSEVAMRCGSAGHLRTSSRGLQHFVHDDGGDGCTAGESWQHLLAKAAIVDGVAAAGWTPEPEAPGEGWVADVLASKDGRRAVFEVQWSPQAPGVYLERQRRYDESGIDAVAWFARQPESAERAGGLRVLQLELNDADEATVLVNERRRPLADAVNDMLSGALAHRAFVNGDHPSDLRVAAAAMDCYRCQAPFAVWDVAEVTVLGPCGTVATRERPAVPVMEMHRYEELPEVRTIGEDLARELGLEPAGLAIRRSSTAGRSYRAFTCPSCGALCGEFFVHERFEGSAPEAEVSAVGPALPVYTPHWCEDDGEGVCKRPNPELAAALAVGAVPSAQGAPDGFARSISIAEVAYIVSGMRMFDGR